MGISNPLTRKQLIEQHIKSMRDYAADLAKSRNPFVSRKRVLERITKCAEQVERAAKIIDLYQDRNQ